MLISSTKRQWLAFKHQSSSLVSRSSIEPDGQALTPVNVSAIMSLFKGTVVFFMLLALVQGLRITPVGSGDESIVLTFTSTGRQLIMRRNQGFRFFAAHALEVAFGIADLNEPVPNQRQQGLVFNLLRRSRMTFQQADDLARAFELAFAGLGVRDTFEEVEETCGVRLRPRVRQVALRSTARVFAYCRSAGNSCVRQVRGQSQKRKAVCKHCFLSCNNTMILLSRFKKCCNFSQAEKLQVCSNKSKLILDMIQHRRTCVRNWVH